jgi:DNA replication and repair protein RecF
LHLEKLSLEGFRNYSSLQVEFGPHLNILVGDNAQGKTNLLEAVYLLATGRSYRAAGDHELLGWEKPSFHVGATISRSYGDLFIEVAYSPERKKKVKVNGTDLKKLSALFGHLNAVIFSPEDLQIVKSSPAHRRRFLDLELAQVDPAYRSFLIDYQQVLVQRNNLLKELSGPRDRRSSREMLEVWDDQLIRLGAKILAKRLIAVRRMSALAKEAHARITETREDLGVSYLAALGGNPEDGAKPGERVEVALDGWREEELREKMAKALVVCRVAEMRRAVTLVGPHRDDLALAVNGREVRSFGSQGQQRTAALALKMAELEFMKEEVGEYPILLLDDVMSELDAARRRFLLDLVQPKAQMFVTTTGLHSFQPRHLAEGKVFSVRHGTLKEVTDAVGVEGGTS